MFVFVFVYLCICVFVYLTQKRGVECDGLAASSHVCPTNGGALLAYETKQATSLNTISLIEFSLCSILLLAENAQTVNRGRVFPLFNLRLPSVSPVCQCSKPNLKC